MKIATAAFFFLLSVETAFATAWVLQAPEVTYSGGQIIETKKSVVLGSFATDAACNTQRSASVQELGRQAREIRDVKDRSTLLDAEREITLLFSFSVTRSVSFLHKPSGSDATTEQRWINQAFCRVSTGWQN